VDEEIVSLKDVWVYLDGVPVLEEINLSIYGNEFLGIIGPNGGGKTTLLKVILGLIQPDKGEVNVFGKPPEEGGRFIGYVPQHSLFDREFPVSVLDVVLMGRTGKMGLFKRYSKEDVEISLNTLETVDMLKFRDRPIGRLSGGERQRVFIARALVSEPRLLLMDEPTTSVDKHLETGLYELLEDLKKEIAIVMVSHDIGAVSVHVDKIACLNHRLFYHDSKEITPEMLEETYLCPIELIAHGLPHRVLKKH